MLTGILDVGCFKILPDEEISNGFRFKRIYNDNECL